MKEEKTIEQALKDAAEQAGAKPEEMKTVAVEQVAGIHVFSSDMKKPPDRRRKSGGNKTNSRNKKAHDRESKEERNEEPWQK